MSKKPIIKKSRRVYLILVAAGLLLISAGTLFRSLGLGLDIRFIEFAAGLGCAAIGLGTLGMFLLRRNPEDERRQKIEEKDERNIKVREHSAYQTFFVTLFSLAVAEVALLFLDYLIPCYIVIGLMAVHVFSYLFLLYRNNKLL